ncbi:hypothetical protein HYX58_00900 [Candidatus Dependentiae bacterium]|nr:hypothetical protein [Candidatus Dependentiae bacterium]
MKSRISMTHLALQTLIALITISFDGQLMAAQGAPISSRVSSAAKAPILVRNQPIPRAAFLKTNIKENIPVYLGTVTISNSSGSRSPNFALSRFPDLGLVGGANMLVNTQGPTLVVPGLLGLNDTVLNDKDQIVIQSTVNPSNYFSVAINYNSDKNSAGEYVGRILTITGTLPASAGASPCTIQVNLQNLLSRFTFSNTGFYYVGVNISFDPLGSFLKLDSLDISWLQNDGGRLTGRAERIVPNQQSRSMDLRTAKIMLDSDNYYQDC